MYQSVQESLDNTERLREYVAHLEMYGEELSKRVKLINPENLPRLPSLNVLFPNFKPSPQPLPQLPKLSMHQSDQTNLTQKEEDVANALLELEKSSQPLIHPQFETFNQIQLQILKLLLREHDKKSKGFQSKVLRAKLGFRPMNRNEFLTKYLAPLMDRGLIEGNGRTSERYYSIKPEFVEAVREKISKLNNLQ